MNAIEVENIDPCAEYRAEGHLVRVVMELWKLESYTAWCVAGQPPACRWPHADGYLGECSCTDGAGPFATYVEARAWCRSHRTDHGLPWQEVMPGGDFITTKAIRAQLAIGDPN